MKRVKMIIEEDYNDYQFAVLEFEDLKTAIKVMDIIFKNGNDVSITLQYID
jgi:hypothetical protein